MRIAVIGGGIAGASVGFHAAAGGADVTVIDQQHDGQATDAGAGIICPWTSRVDNAEHFRLGAAGAAYYPELVDRLSELGEDDIGYRRVGALRLGQDPDDVAAAEALVRQRRDAHPEAGEISVLSGTHAQELFPPLRSDLAAVHLSGAGRVDGRMLCSALLRAGMRLGATIRHGAAELIIDRGRVAGVRVDGVGYEADLVVAAAGSWTPELLMATGIELPLEPQRGQIMHLALPAADTSGWPVVQPPNRHYLVPFDDARVVVGATREERSGFDYRMTAGGLAEILDRALAAAPGLTQATHQQTRVGFRPVSADGLPYLGWLLEPAGIAVATGFGPTGLTMAPFAGKLIADLVLGHPPDFDLAPYDPCRVADSVQTLQQR